MVDISLFVQRVLTGAGVGGEGWGWGGQGQRNSFNVGRMKHLTTVVPCTPRAEFYISTVAINRVTVDGAALEYSPTSWIFTTS